MERQITATHAELMDAFRRWQKASDAAEGIVSEPETPEEMANRTYYFMNLVDDPSLDA